MARERGKRWSREKKSAKLLKRKRDGMGVTMDLMAQRLGVSKMTVLQIEKSGASRRLAEKVAREYGVEKDVVDVVSGRVPEWVTDRDLKESQIEIGLGYMAGEV